MSELVLLGLVVRAEAVVHAQAQRLSETIVGWNPEYCQYRQGGRARGRKGAGFRPNRLLVIRRFISGYPGGGCSKRMPLSAIVSGHEAMKPVLGLVNHTHTPPPSFSTMRELAHVTWQNPVAKCKTGQRVPLVWQAPNGVSCSTFARIPTPQLPCKRRRTLFPNE